MATSIDDLQIEITAKSKSASASITKLVNKLDRLSQSISNIKTTNLDVMSNSIENLSKSMQAVSAVKTKDFTRLAKNIEKIGNVNTSAISNAAASINQLSNSFAGLSNASASATQVSEFTKSLSKIGGKSVQTAISNMPRLSSALNNVFVSLSKAPAVSQNVIDMTNALANLASQGKKVGSATTSLNKSLARTDKSLTSTTKKTKSLAYAFGKFYANYFLIVRGVKSLWSSIESTADYMEAYNFYNVAFDKLGKEWSGDFKKYGYENAEAYSKSFAERMNDTLGKLSGVKLDTENMRLYADNVKNLGLNIKEVTQYAAQLVSVTNSVGQTGETSLAVSQAFIKLAGDMSSLYNVDYSDVMQNLQSGLIGQSRALYKYGIDITNATLQTKAYALGLEKSVSEMTQAEKMQLRVLTILEQSEVAFGNLANEIEQPSNQIRLLKNNMSELAQLIGQLFMPILQKVLPVINGVTLAIKNLISNIAGIMGVKLEFNSSATNDFAEGLEDVSDAYGDIEESAKKALNATLGIDELNINAPKEESSGAGAGGGIDLTDQIVQATEQYNKIWQEAFDNMKSRAQDIADTFKNAFGQVEQLFADIAIGDWFKVGEDVSGMSVAFFDFFTNALKSVDWETIGTNIGEYLKGLNWLSVIGSIGELLWTAFSSALELYKGTFDAAPIETGILTAVTLLSFTGVGKIIAIKIVEKIAEAFVTSEAAGILAAGFKSLFGSAAATSALAFFTPISKALVGIGLIFGGLYIAVKSFIDMFTNGFSWIGEIVMIVGIALGVVGAIIFGAPAAVAAVIGGIIAAVATLVIVVKDNWDSIKKFTEDLVKKIKDFFSGLWTGIKLIWSGVSIWFETSVLAPLKTKFKQATDKIGEFFESVWVAIKTGAVSAMNGVIGAVESGINGIVSLLNFFLSGINAMVEGAGDLIGKDWSGFKLIQEVNFGRIPMYEIGGFPEDGLFMANHNELIGRFTNGQTAVANNEQIVSGIKSGVREAVSEILEPYLSDIARNTRETADKDFSVNIGDRDIARANQRGRKSLGYTLVT